MATLNGKLLVVKWDSNPTPTEALIACSTSCTLTLNQATTEATCKDANSWTSQIPGAKTWEITCDALYQDTDAVGTHQFVDLSELIITGPNDVSVIFGEDPGPNTWKGNAVMTSCSLTGDDNSPATYTATFTGNGALVGTYV